MLMKKLEYVSYMKVWAMIWVVLYHCLCGYSDIWGTDFSWQEVTVWSNLAHILVYFHMPTFVLMSAFLYAYLCDKQVYRKSATFVLKKTKRIFIPYIIWAFLVCIILDCDFFYLFLGPSHTWYLLFLFEAFLSFHFINKIPNKSKYAVFALLYALCFALSRNTDTPFLGMGYYVRYMPYFIVGYYGYHFLKNRPVKYVDAQTAGMGSLMLFLLAFMFFNNKFILTLLSLAVIFSFLIIFRQKESVLPFKKYMLWVDKYTMGIYLIHHIIIQEMNCSSFFHPYMSHYLLYPTLQFLASFGISVILTHILQKFKLGRISLGC